MKNWCLLFFDFCRSKCRFWDPVDRKLANLSVDEQSFRLRPRRAPVYDFKCAKPERRSLVPDSLNTLGKTICNGKVLSMMFCVVDINKGRPVTFRWLEFIGYSTIDSHSSMSVWPWVPQIQNILKKIQSFIEQIKKGWFSYETPHPILTWFLGSIDRNGLPDMWLAINFS